MATEKRPVPKRRKPRRALVTGGAGFIGSHVCRYLLEDGMEVRAMVLEGEDRMNLDDLPVEIVVGDITKPESVRAAMDGCDELYHLAAIYATWLPDPKLMYRVNVHGSKVVLAEAMRQKLSKVVYTASIAAVGHAETGRPVNEDHAWNLWDTGDHYVRSKYYGELEARRFAKEGLPVVIVNPAFPFGARDLGPTPTGAFILKSMNGQFPFYFEGGINVVDVEDVALGHVLAARKGTVGERYILGHKNFLLSEFFALVGDTLGCPAPRRELPVETAIRVATAMQFVSDHYTHRPPMAAPGAVRVASKKMWYDCSKAVKDLGMPQSSIEDAIVRAAEWFRGHGYAK